MNPGTATITHWDASRTWLVTLHGDHDLATRDHLAEQTKMIWGVCKVAIIDLSDVEFVDSGLIRWLLDVERQLEESGAFTLSVIEGTPGSLSDRLFGLLRMRHVLACYSTLEQALAQAPSRDGQTARARPTKRALPPSLRHGLRHHA